MKDEFARRVLRFTCVLVYLSTTQVFDTCFEIL